MDQPVQNLLTLLSQLFSEIANVLAVSVNTVKSQLASVYAKTGTSRQGQLVRLLSVLGSQSR